ncbi:MAG: type II toxin-antitoxin system HipA family toxin [Betaproteobacteria bacterium]|nr:type II toxin-antitoxin system HipA family toxin [Betaproteobacteria bacterium]
MPRRSTASTLAVWMNGRQAGTWTVTPSRGHEFAYAENWVHDTQARPISLSMPLRPREPYRGMVVSNFFENLLPDNKTIRERLQREFSTPSTRAFDLLNEIGRDCVGAIQLLPPGETPVASPHLDMTELTEQEVAAILRNVPVSGRLQDDANEDAFRISIAGMQEKTALIWHRDRWHMPKGATPTTHILKLPLGLLPQGVDLGTSVENEWLCSLLMRAFGLPVAKSRIVMFEDQKVLAVERFDREWTRGGEWIERLPQEDFAQITGTPPERKYESEGGPGIARIMDQLLGAQQPEEDRRRFMKTQVIFWLLCAIDGHAKNFSVFIERQGRFRMTPGYDVLSAHPVLGDGAGKIAMEKAKMAMAVWGENRHYRWSEMRPAHFRQTAKDCGLGAWSEHYLDEVLEQTPRAIEAVEHELPDGFPAGIAEAIFKGVIAASNALRMAGG